MYELHLNEVNIQEEWIKGVQICCASNSLLIYQNQQVRFFTYANKYYNSFYFSMFRHEC